MIKSEVIDVYGTKVTLNHFLVREVFEALEKNGFEHLRGQWVSFDGRLVVGGCVLGQAAINLSVVPHQEEEVYNLLKSKIYDKAYADALAKDTDFDDDIEVLDPYTNRPATLAEQLNRFEVDPSSIWYTGSRAGDVIIHWNDHRKATHNDDGDYNGWEYALETYAEVVAMAKDVLSPYFEEVIYLVNKEYKVNLQPA